MIVFKIREKSSGLFLNKNGHSSKRGGRVYTSIGHIKTSYNGPYPSIKDDNRYEIVQLELQEMKTIPISTVL